jgi:hypothetical protein
MNLKRFLAISAYVATVLLLLPENGRAEAIYGANGQYQGQVQQSGNVLNFYNAKGEFVGSVQNSNDQANFYGSTGRYEGSVSAPVYIAPPATPSNMYIVPQVPQVRRVPSL